MGDKKERKKEKKKIVPKRSGPIFCRGGLRLAGRRAAFFGCAATPPPPASIAAPCSRAAPWSEDAANTRYRPPRPPRRLLMTVRVTPPSPAVAASPLSSLFVTCCVQKKRDSRSICMGGVCGVRGVVRSHRESVRRSGMVLVSRGAIRKILSTLKILRILNIIL